MAPRGRNLRPLVKFRRAAQILGRTKTCCGTCRIEPEDGKL
jgi:hypothetical protein